MTQKVFATFVAVLAGFCLTAAAPAEPPLLGGFLSPDPSGSFQIDGVRFRIMCFGLNWNGLKMQDAKCVVADKDFPVATADTFKLQGSFNAPVGAFKFSETITSNQKFQAIYNLRMTAAKPVNTNTLALHVAVPASRYIDIPIRVNGEIANFKEKADPKTISKNFQGKTIEIPLVKGVLTISGSFAATFQDTRHHGLDIWEFRIQPDGDKPPLISEASFNNLTFTYVPYLNAAVDLRKAANAAFAGEGRKSDLRAFPTEPAEYAGIGFDVIDPAGNNNRATSALRGKKSPGYPVSATVELENPIAAGYLYILNAVVGEPSLPTEIGTVICEYDDNQYVDKSEQAFKVISGVNTADFLKPRGIKNATIGWQHDAPDSRIGFYMTRFPLSGKPVKKITFQSSGVAEWLIPAATLADRQHHATPLVMEENVDWSAIKNRKDVKPGSVLDFSNLLDAPAGKFGFVRNVNGRLEFENRPGVAARFYGANIAYGVNFTKKALADKMAADVAATGYNLIRFHHFDKDLAERKDGNCTTLDAGRLDRMDYLLSALKKRGIYSTIDLYTLRRFAKGEFPENPDWAPIPEEYKALIFISDAAMNNFLEFSANLLNHVNPYTGLAWKEDPALITVSLINEDALFNLAFRTPPVAKLYQAKFDAWLAERKITPTPKNMAGHRQKFIAETYLKGYNKLEARFRELGVRALLTDQNSGASVSLTVLRERYDYVDCHFYWSHPVFPEKSWSVPMQVNNVSSIDFYAGGLRSLFQTRILGKPFAVTEWDYCNPNSYAVEGAFLVGAYAALQDWSILCRFDYTSWDRDVEHDDSRVYLFSTINDPLRRLSELAGTVAFLRGDVKISEITYPFLLSRKYLDSSKGGGFPDVGRRLGLIGKTGSLLADPGKAPALPSGTRALISIPGYWKNVKFPVPFLESANSADAVDDLNALLKQGAITGREYDPENDRYRSSTGELSLDRKNGTFQSVTPNSESFVLKEDQALAGKFAAVSNRLSFGAFLIATRDEKPLESSKRLLLLHLTSTRNTGQRFRSAEADTVEDWGKLPLLVRRGEAEVTVNRDLAGFKLYAVDLGGSRVFEIPMTFKDGKTCFTLKNVTPEGVFAAYELVAE